MGEILKSYSLELQALLNLLLSLQLNLPRRQRRKLQSNLKISFSNQISQVGATILSREFGTFGDFDRFGCFLVIVNWISKTCLLVSWFCLFVGFVVFVCWHCLFCHYGCGANCFHAKIMFPFFTAASVLVALVNRN